MHHRFYVETLPVSGEVLITGEELHHAVRVLRIREGEPIELFDGRGRGVTATVARIDKAEFAATIVAEATTSRESRLDLTLAMAVIQLEKFELVLQKATELGARAIVPLSTDRAEVREERYRGKHERWQKIVFEAAKQSGRLMLPTLAPPATFDEMIGRAGTRILFDADIEPSPPAVIAAATVFIGPEGGWSERELTLARSQDVRFWRLGPRRLRAETAAIAALTRVGVEHGDLG